MTQSVTTKRVETYLITQ